MNRFVVAALAACLAQFALGCSVERTEIYEPGQVPEQTSTEKGEKIDTARTSDDTQIAYPVPTTVAEPVDTTLARSVDDRRDFLTPGVKFSEVMPVQFDVAIIHQIPNVEGVIIPTLDIDPNVQVTQPSIGASPLLVIDAPPTRAQAAALPNPF